MVRWHVRALQEINSSSLEQMWMPSIELAAYARAYISMRPWTSILGSNETWLREAWNSKHSDVVRRCVRVWINTSPRDYYTPPPRHRNICVTCHIFPSPAKAHRGGWSGFLEQNHQKQPMASPSKLHDLIDTVENKLWRDARLCEHKRWQTIFK